MRSERLLTSLTASYLYSHLRPDQLSPEQPVIDHIVPVPLHYQRLFMRGFNQAYQLASAISKKLKQPVNSNLVHRIRHTDKQEGLSPQQRKANLSHAFAVQSEVKDQHILLVDDVITTGATAQSISQLFKQQGAKRVSLICIARTPSHI